jgi:GNAT superfamily N-acetyltransferase
MFSKIPYSSNDKIEIVRLLGDISYKKEIWDWQFLHNPFDRPFDPVILSNGDKIVGFNGVMPIRVHLNNTEIDALWSCDFYVDAEVRGKGLGKSIKTELHKQSNLIMALGISPSAEHVLRRMGWKKNSEVFGYDRHQKITSFRTLIFSILQLFNKYKSIFRRLFINNKQYSISVEDELPSMKDVDDLWEGIKNDYGKIVRRDYRYLDWKYQHHPLADYKFIIARENAILSSLLVYRIADGKAHLVDYLGPHNNYNQKYLLVKKFLSSVSGCRQITSTTSDPTFGSVLIDSGFVKKRDQPRFYIFSNSPGASDMERDWFIMSGDSDGELLLAARGHSKTISNNGSSSLTMEVCDEKSFFNMKEEWSELLCRSDANLLFLSWSWMYAWWETWSKIINAELLLIAVRENGVLVGIAPFYTIQSKGFLGIVRRDIHMIGNARRIMPTVRSEYMDVITESGRRNEIVNAVISHITQQTWETLTVCDHAIHEHFLESDVAANTNLVSFLSKKDSGVILNVSKDFDAWKSGLGKDFRLKAFNRRNYLSKKVDIQYCEASENDAIEYFDELNKLHNIRWGEGCFINLSLEFHKRFISLLTSDQKLRFSGLKLNGKFESILYDVQAGDKIYNLQAGYNENYDKKVSLGTLHLGYAIERAFKDPQIQQYDMLAGGGKKTYYKQHFKGDRVDFYTVILVRNPILKLVYSARQSLVKFLH